jgi:signal peptidase II|tara:strand:+ start:118 stop:594 length:477 start_codon:yes stop_codon:yes gene_type:complete
MKIIKENYIFFIIIFVLFYIDRLSKNKIINLLENQNYLFINDYLNLNLVFNTGIGFGLLSLQDGFFYNFLSTLIFLIVIILVFFMVKSNYKEKYFFSLIIGGAIGNLYDRIIFKAVPDFIDFHIQEFHWFTFNIADIFISFGIIFMILNELLNKKNEI